jgi:hypothetical protein
MCASRSRKIAAGALIVMAAAAAAFGGVADTVHNLSVTGPGAIKSPTETQICVFCHSPHNANPNAPLWNHSLSAVANYKMYWSSTMKAYPSAGAAPQPDGASKLCLSCHDGTIALGAVGGRATPIVVSGGPTMPSTAPGYLGTDLSGSHPVSFVYDNALAVARNAAGGMPLFLPSTRTDPDVKLDAQKKMQCTTCHDPHDDSNYRAGMVPHFYVKPTWSETCLSCHD